MLKKDSQLYNVERDIRKLKERRKNKIIVDLSANFEGCVGDYRMNYFGGCSCCRNVLEFGHPCL